MESLEASRPRAGLNEERGGGGGTEGGGVNGALEAKLAALI